MIVNPGTHHFDPDKRTNHVLDANGTKTVLVTYANSALPGDPLTATVLNNNPAAVVSDA